MSAGNQGGALVRSPPGFVGVDGNFGPHLAGESSWESPRRGLDMPPLQGRVTRLNSSSCSSAANENASQSTTGGRLNKKTKNKKDMNCTCGAWSHVRQLEHDMLQLRHTHSIVLRGLHLQLEELKVKNRDLTFQILMGPLTSTAKEEAPPTSESDASTMEDVKRDSDSLQDQTSSTDCDKKADNITPANHVIPMANQLSLANQISNLSISRPAGKLDTTLVVGDPRKVRLLDLELLQGELEETKKCLKEERDKNRVLTGLVNDLKKRLLPFKESKLEDTNFDDSISKQSILPHISNKGLNNSQLLRPQNRQLQTAKDPKETPKTLSTQNDLIPQRQETNRTTLPAIVQRYSSPKSGNTEYQSRKGATISGEKSSLQKYSGASVSPSRTRNIYQQSSRRSDEGSPSHLTEDLKNNSSNKASVSNLNKSLNLQPSSLEDLPSTIKKKPGFGSEQNSSRGRGRGAVGGGGRGGGAGGGGNGRSKHRGRPHKRVGRGGKGKYKKE